MTDSLPKKRRYDSSRRREQARQTRLQIAETARRLFLERGYSGATIEAIAEGAHVANETVYAIFKNKRNILQFLLDISLGGDDQPMRILDRPKPQAILHDSDQRRQLTDFAQDITQILDRAALRAYLERATKAEWTEESIKESMVSLTKVGKLPVDTSRFFRDLYLVLLGKERGPRAAPFLAVLEKAWVLKRLREATG